MGRKPVRWQAKNSLGIWKPSIKGIWDKRYDRELQSTAYDRKGFETVLECYPFTSKLLSGLRFHAAYTFCSTDFKGIYNDIATQNMQTFLIGTRWMFKAK